MFRLCLLAPHGALAVIAFSYSPTITTTIFPNILLKPLTVTSQLLDYVYTMLGLYLDYVQTRFRLCVNYF